MNDVNIFNLLSPAAPALPLPDESNLAKIRIKEGFNNAALQAYSLVVFERFDSFVGRLNTVREFFKTAQQFLKLEKVEIGGIRGRALSGRVAGVHEEFKVIFLK